MAARDSFRQQFLANEAGGADQCDFHFDLLGAWVRFVFWLLLITIYARSCFL
jgi:hypothetical protein